VTRRAATCIATSAAACLSLSLSPGLRGWDSRATAAPVHAIVHFRQGLGAIADSNRGTRLGYVRVQNGVLPIAPPLQDPRADAVLVLESPAGLEATPAGPMTAEVKLYGLRLSPAVSLLAPGATVILRNEDRLPVTLRCPGNPALLPSSPLQPGAKLAVTLPGGGEFLIDSPEYPHLRGLLLAPHGVASRLTLSEFGTVGVAQLDAPPGAYQAKLLFAGRVAASTPVMVTPSGAEFVLQVPPATTPVAGELAPARPIVRQSQQGQQGAAP
jgi:hypothetical protein